MADAPYDPETGEWTVFADPRPDKDGPYGKAVAHVPGARPFSTPTRVLLWGDTKRAESYYPQAAQLLAQANRENVNDQPFFFKERKFGSDVRFKCSRDLYQDFIEIEAKPKPIPPGLMSLDFNAGAENSFADNYFTDSINGLQAYYLNTPVPGGVGDYIVSPGAITSGGYTGIGCASSSSNEEVYSIGALRFTPKTTSLFRTIHTALSCDISDGFSSGYNDAGWATVGVNSLGYISGIDKFYRNGSFDGRIIYWNGSPYYDNNNDSGVTIISQMCTPTGNTVYGGVGCVYSLYLNGEKVSETDETRVSEWALYGIGVFGYDGEDFLYIHNWQESRNAQSAVHQIQYINDLVTEYNFMSQIESLAKTWGV